MLRNCENMIDVWKILDEEYGNNIDICPEVIGELTSFKYTTKTPTHQFLELYTKYNHAKQDLKQVNKLSELNNLTTLKMISERLPGELLKREYAKSRALKKGQAGVTELDIFDAFMLEQYNVEKERSKFDENEVKSPKFFRGHCNNCSTIVPHQKIQLQIAPKDNLIAMERLMLLAQRSNQKHVLLVKVNILSRKETILGTRQVYISVTHSATCLQIKEQI